MKHKKTADIFRIIILSVILSTAIGYSFAAWTPPTGAPPASNTPPPVNVGTAVQTKLGALNIEGWFTAGAGVFTSQVGIGKIPADTLDVNGSATVNGNIHGVSTPVAGTDAVNKDYVDAATGGGMPCGSFVEENGLETSPYGACVGDVFQINTWDSWKRAHCLGHAVAAIGMGFNNGSLVTTKLYQCYTNPL